MTVQCLKCGQAWPRDPALEVECPQCHARIGQMCCRPSGHAGPFVELHAERDILALQTVPGYGRCPAAQASAGDQPTVVVEQARLF